MSNPQYDEFTRLVDRVLAVPHLTIQKREAEYKAQVEKNPKRRGPKRKVKPSASPDPAA